MSQNQFSYQFTDEKNTAIDTLLDSVETEFEFTVGLDTPERRSLPKMGRKNSDFVKQGRKHILGNPEYLTTGDTTEEFLKDYNSGIRLRELEKRLAAILGRVRDSAMLAESEAFQTARLYYKNTKTQAANGDDTAERIVRDLSVHFKRSPAPESNSNEPAPNNE